jgi:hypothetical protein
LPRKKRRKEWETERKEPEMWKKKWKGKRPELEERRGQSATSKWSILETSMQKTRVTTYDSDEEKKLVRKGGKEDVGQTRDVKGGVAQSKDGETRVGRLRDEEKWVGQLGGEEGVDQLGGQKVMNQMRDMEAGVGQLRDGEAEVGQLRDADGVQ